MPLTELILIYHLNFFASLRLCVEAFGFFSRVISTIILLN